MYLLILPAVTFGIKTYVSNKIADAISSGIREGVETAQKEVLKAIYKGLYNAFSNVCINIVLLVAAVYFLPLFASREASIFIVANVYLASLIHGVYNCISSIPVTYKIVRHYRFDLKSYLKDELYKEAYSCAYERAKHKIDNAFFLSKPFVYLFGSAPREIAYKIALPTSIKASEIIYHEIIKKVSIIVMLLTLYYALFRYIVAPFLIEDVTGLSVMDTLIYPFIFSVEYFLSF